MVLKKTNKYDIVVAGSGFLGLSTAYQLTKNEPYRVAVINSPKEKSLSSELCSISFAGSLDNFTRPSHQWGQAKAAKIWKFFHEAYEFSHSFANLYGIRSKKGKRLRLVDREDEQIEVTKACAQLKQAGFEASFIEKYQKYFPFLSDKFKAIQNEGLTGGWIDPASLQDFFKKTLQGKVDYITAHAYAIDSSESNVKIKLENDNYVESQVVLLCCHQGIKQLLPTLKESLVTYQDELMLLSYKNHSSSNILPALTFSLFHGYIWGCFLDNNRVLIGGARFLRKDAGIAATKPESNSKVEQYLFNALKSTFPNIFDVEVIQIFSGLELNSCDELPMIGPMFGDDKILLASGFKGQGLTLGLYAGKCLADLVLTSEKNILLDIFNPKRFRTL